MSIWLKSLDRNELTYWVGLALLFVGLCLRVSVATALIVTGAIITLESVVTSYMITWLSLQQSVRK